MNALVTGGNGFVGSHLVEALVAGGHRVRCLVRPTSDLTWLEGLDVELVQGEITDRASLGPDLFEGIDRVFSFAGATKASSRAAYHAANEDGARNVVEACLESGAAVRRFVHCSTLLTYAPPSGDEPLTESSPQEPITDYGRSKLAGERAVLEHEDELPVVVLRPPAVYGPRDRDIYAFFKLVQRGLSLRIGPEHQRFSAIYVKDLARAALQAAESPRLGASGYLVADPTPRRWSEFSDEVSRALGKRTVRVRIPDVVIDLFGWAGAGFSAVTGRSVLLNREKLKEIRCPNWTCAATLAERDLGFEPRWSLSKSVRETAEWYRAHRWL